MSTQTFHLPNHDNLAVSVPSSLSQDRLLAFDPFTSWLTTLQKSLSLQSQPKHPFHADPYRLHSITVQSYDSWSPPRLGFVKLTAAVRNAAGESLAGGVFLRGGSVGMLVMLVPDDIARDSDERYVLLTVQPRVPAGSLAFVELPAGMVDDHGSFAGAAAAEINEELGLEITEDQLTCLTELAFSSTENDSTDEGLAQAMFPSAGGCDECVRIFAHERVVPRAQLDSWTGKLTGLRDEGERITLKLVPMQDLWKEGARDSKALSALALWEGLKREGKVGQRRA